MNNQVPPKTYLIESILVTIFCCLPFGIIGIVNSARVESRFYAGDVDGALQASKQAKTWTLVGFLIGISGVVLYLMFIFVFGLTMFSMH